MSMLELMGFMLVEAMKNIKAYLEMSVPGLNVIA